MDNEDRHRIVARGTIPNDLTGGAQLDDPSEGESDRILCATPGAFRMTAVSALRPCLIIHKGDPVTDRVLVLNLDGNAVWNPWTVVPKARQFPTVIACYTDR